MLRVIKMWHRKQLEGVLHIYFAHLQKPCGFSFSLLWHTHSVIKRVMLPRRVSKWKLQLQGKRKKNIFDIATDHPAKITTQSGRDRRLLFLCLKNATGIYPMSFIVSWDLDSQLETTTNKNQIVHYNFA